MSDIITPSGLPTELLTITNGNTLIEVYNPDTGQNEKTKMSTIKSYVSVGSVVVDWSDLTTYSTQGELVVLDSMIFSATGETGNLDKDPTDPNNAIYWYQPEDKVYLLSSANKGKVLEGEMHTIHDRASANYAQNMLVSQQSINGIQKEFHIIHLDGSVVTGNTTLEALFGIGGDLNPYINIFAPDFAGTRTLIDMGGRVTEGQSGVGGHPDTLAIGTVHDDYGQRITGTVWGTRLSTGMIDVFDGVFGNSPTPDTVNGGSGAAPATQKLTFDSSTSISPNPAKTDDLRTAHAALVTGASYIVVVQVA